MRVLFLLCALTGTARAQIIGGAETDGDLGVVALTDGTGEPYCTGTLVSPHVVVTAGHCVFFAPPRYVFVGSSAGEGGNFLDPAEAYAIDVFDSNTLENDLGVVILAEDPPGGATPYKLSRRAPVVGELARFVGYGYTETGPGGDYGKKYEGSSLITDVAETLFGYGVATCNGDSGGPAFVMHEGEELLAGVTSFGDTGCDEYGFDTRVDVFADWIDEQVTLHDSPTCAADGLCVAVCPEPDLDCPPVCVDDDICEQRCAADVDCERDGDDDWCAVSAGRPGSAWPLALLLSAVVIGLFRRKIAT